MKETVLARTDPDGLLDQDRSGCNVWLALALGAVAVLCSAWLLFGT